MLIVERIEDVTADTRCIYFKPDDELEYQAGQYITLLLDLNGREVRRPYSLSSSPALGEPPFITVKEIENGEVSRYLHNYLQVGDQLPFLAPNGRFCLTKTIPNQLVFLAAGSGISPIFGLIKEALVTSNAHIHLLYSNKSKTTTIFHEELIALQAQYPDRFSITWFFSDSKFLLKARLSRIALEEYVKENLLNLNEVAFYTCGPFVYMEMVFITLLTLGVTQEQLFKETFTTHDEEDDDEGSLLDDETKNYVDSTVTIISPKQTYRLQVKSTETILQAALKQQVPLSYSCMRGMCSSCVCSIEEGEVNMYNNQVLTDREVTEGRVLICTAKALTPNVTIKTN
jgi:ring-1,2-phenylacetyl-CoA epoxidase subunit PaaE